MVERLRGRAGQARRLRILRREPLCRHCKAKGIYTAATEVDHIVELALGGPDTEANLQPLCNPCHARKTQAAFRRKPRVEIGGDGWPTEIPTKSTP